MFTNSTYAETVQAKISGMVCAFCANGLEAKFNKVDGVKKIDISLEKGSLSVEFAGKIKLSDEELKELITSNGYEVRSLKRLK